MQLSEAIKEANFFSDKLYGKRLRNDLRSRVAVACFAVSQQHYNAILILLSNSTPLVATSLALLRILVESVIRGLWISHVATDADIDRYVKSGTKVSMPEMMKSIDSVTGLDSYKAIYKGSWSALSTYTHTGEFQVQRWLKTGHIEPQYSEQEISELIKLSSLAAGLAFQAVLAISSAPENEL